MREASPAATIKCTSCGAEFVLGQIDLQQFADWEIIDDPLLADTTTSAASYSSPLLLGEAVAAETSPTISLVESYSKSHFDRPRRKRKSPIWSVIPIILGGAAAFPLALMILWYGLGRDVGGMGPRIAAYAPWLVPKQFHPLASSNNAASRNRTPPTRGSSGFRSFDGVLPALPVEDQPSAETGTPTTPTDDGLVDSASESTTPATDSLSDATVTSDSETPAALPLEDGGVAKLFADIDHAEQLVPSLQQAMSSAASNRLELLMQLYDSLSGLAVQLHQLGADSPVRRTVNDKMLNIARAIKQDAPLQTVLDKLVERKSPDLTATAQPLGIVATLEVSEAELQGDSWKVTGTHKLPSSLSIRIPRAIAPNLPVGSRWLVLGVISSDETNESTELLKVSYLYTLE